MRFYIPGKVMSWLGPVAIIAIGSLVIIGNPVSRATLCDGTQNCLATWVGALSGWAAALAASITIGSLFQQAKAAQKQTDFQLGDAEPTLDAVQHGERNAAVVLWIRNWNRRSMIIRRIRLNTSQKISVLHLSFDNKRKELGPAPKHDWTFSTGATKKFEPAVMLEGWVRREQEPPILKLSLAGFFEKREAITDEWDRIPIEIQYELAGVRKVSRLTAHVHLASISIAPDQDASDQLVEEDEESTKD